MEQLLRASELYVGGLTSKQHEILYLWTKCPKIFREAIQQHSELTPETSHTLRTLVESRFEIVRQLDDIFASAPTLNSIKAPRCKTNLVRTLLHKHGPEGVSQAVKAQIPHYSSTTTLDRYYEGDVIHKSVDLTLRLCRNVPVLSLSKVSQWPKQKEVLLPRNIKLNNIPPTWKSAKCQVSLARLFSPKSTIETFPSDLTAIPLCYSGPIGSLPDYLRDFDEWNMKRMVCVVRIWQILSYGWGIMQDDDMHWRSHCRTIVVNMGVSAVMKDVFGYVLDKLPQPREVQPCQVRDLKLNIQGLPEFSSDASTCSSQDLEVKIQFLKTKRQRVRELAAYIRRERWVIWQM